MWTTKVFKTRAKMAAWIERNGARVQFEEIAVNNAYGVIYRKLKSIRLAR